MPVREPRKKEENATHPPLPPFTRETTVQKVRAADYAWDSRNPEKVALAHTTDSRWRNQAEFPNGRAEIVQFMKRKWVIAPIKDCRSTNRSASIVGHLVAVLMDIRS
jgi:nuclear transport factor 2 (NTF2) superfamily protein